MSFRDWLADPDTKAELHEIEAEVGCGRPLALILLLLMDIGSSLDEQNTALVRRINEDEDE